MAYGPSLANREKHLPDKLIKDLASHGELEIRLSDALKQIKLIPLFVPIDFLICRIFSRGHYVQMGCLCGSRDLP